MMDSESLYSASILMQVPIVPHLRSKMIHYLGVLSLPALMPAIRAHLDCRYCGVCGEYLYNPFPEREIRHWHYPCHRQRYLPLLEGRIRFHHDLMMVEWERRFPRVMRFPLAQGGVLGNRRAVRIPSLQLWSLDEWNLLYSWLPRNLGSVRFLPIAMSMESSLFVPSMNFVRESDRITSDRHRS